MGQYSNFPNKEPMRSRFTTTPSSAAKLAARINKTLRETGRKQDAPLSRTPIPVWARPGVGLLIDEYRTNYGEEPELTWRGRAKAPRKDTWVLPRLPSAQHIISSEQGGSNTLGNVAILRQADNSRLASGQSPQDFYNRDLTDPDVAQGKAQAVYPWLAKDGKPAYKYAVGAGRNLAGIISFAEDNFDDVQSRRIFVENATEYVRTLNDIGEDVRLNRDDLDALKQRTIADLDKQTKTGLTEKSVGVSLRNLASSIFNAIPDESQFFSGQAFTEPTRAWKDMPSEQGRRVGRFGRLPANLWSPRR
jgi:hypothetical protein